jgi:hypothetical protein
MQLTDAEKKNASAHLRETLKKPPLVCAGAALMVCSLYIWEIRVWPHSLLRLSAREYAFAADGMDMAGYVAAALGIFNGSWPNDAFYQAPLYPFALAPFLSLWPQTLCAAVLNILFFAGTVFLAAVIAERAFGRAAGYACGALLILYGGYVFLTAVPLGAVSEAFFGTLAFYFILRLRDKFACGWAAAAGFAGALAALSRPNFLLVCPAVIFLVCLESALKTKDFRRAGTALALAAAFFAAGIAPAVIWNNSRPESKGFALVNTNGWPTYVLCNSRDSDVFNYHHPKKPLMSPLSWEFWRHQMRKAAGFWRSAEYPQNVCFYLYRENSFILRALFVSFGAMGALFIGSLVWSLPRMRERWIFFAYPGLFFLTVAAYYIIGRFRTPAVPAMAVPAGAFLIFLAGGLFRLVTGRGADRYLPPAAAAALAVFILSKPFETLILPKYHLINAGQSLRALDPAGHSAAMLEYIRMVPGDSFEAGIFAASRAFQDDVKTARAVTERQLAREKDEKLRARLEDTLTEISAMEARDLSLWRAMIERGETKGFIKELYFTTLDIMRKRESAGLPALPGK